MAETDDSSNGCASLVKNTALVIVQEVEGLKPVQKSTRKSTPRVKSGCKTCRVRRIKCDETRPSCVKCTKTGRECDGYVATICIDSDSACRSNALSRGAARGVCASSALLEVTAYSIPFRMPGSQRDRQLIHYFAVQGGREISGFVSNEFWTRTALLVSQNETVVRQSLIALSSLHLDLSRSATDGAALVSHQTLLQYGKALRSLQARISKPLDSKDAHHETTKAALFCCVLFYCFESSVRDTRAAVKHLENGLQLLKAQQPEAFEKDEEMASLLEMFGRLDLQATMFDDGRTPVLDLVTSAERVGGFTVVNGEPFPNLQDAQRGLTRILNWLLRLSLDTKVDHEYLSTSRRQASPALEAEAQCLAAEFGRWAERFDALEATQRSSHGAKDSNQRREYRRAAKLLQVEHGAARMLLVAKLTNDPSIFTTTPNYPARAIVTLCELLLQPDDVASISDSPRQALSVETGVVIALYILAIKCLDELVVDKALKLLLGCPRREGLYDAAAMATLVGGLKELRVQRLCKKAERDLDSDEDWPLEHWIPSYFCQVLGGASSLSAIVGTVGFEG